MMDDAPKMKNQQQNINDHLANERTFLAWIRTCIAIMAFGFVVEKFSLFLRQITQFIRTDNLALNAYSLPSPPRYAPIFGIFLVILGGVMCFLAFLKFKTTEKQIKTNDYAPSLLLDVMLTLTIALLGIFLVIYLIHSVVR